MRSQTAISATVRAAYLTSRKFANPDTSFVSPPAVPKRINCAPQTRPDDHQEVGNADSTHEPGQDVRPALGGAIRTGASPHGHDAMTELADSVTADGMSLTSCTRASCWDRARTRRWRHRRM